MNTRAVLGDVELLAYEAKAAQAWYCEESG